MSLNCAYYGLRVSEEEFCHSFFTMSLKFDNFGLRVSEERLCHSFLIFLCIRVLEGGTIH